MSTASEVVSITEAWIKRIAPDERAGKAATLPAGAERARFWDTSLPGFGVVVGARSATFIARYRAGGKRRDVTIGRWGRVGAGDDGGDRWTVERARREAMRLLGARPSATAAPGAAAAGATLRQALDFHIGRMERGENRRGKVCSPRSIDTLRGTVERHLADHLDRPLVELTADVLEATVERIERTTPRRSDSNPDNPPGRALANRLLAVVSAIWRSYHKRHGLPVACPVERLTPGALKPRDTRIADDGFAAWHGRVMAMRNHVRRDLQLVGLFTAVRTDGLCSLTWDEVDFDDDLIQIARAKGDRPYTIPMTATVREILERRRRDNAIEFAPLGGDHGYVFPSVTRARPFHVIPVAEPKEREVNPATGERVKALPGIHASRRTFNSVAMELGCPPEVREMLLNHAGRGVNVRHYGRPERWDHAAAWAAKIEAALWQRIRAEPKPKRGRARLRAV